MAKLNSTFTQGNLVGLLNYTMSKIEKRVFDATFNDFTLFQALQSEGGVKQGMTGDDVTWPLEIAKNDTVAARYLASEIPRRLQPIHEYASQDFAEYSGSATLDELEMDKNGGKERLIPYAMSHIENLRVSMKDLVNQAAHSGSGTAPSAAGLTTIIPETNTSGTLHNVNLATNSWFRNQSAASSCSTTNAFGPICIKEVDELAKLASGGQGKTSFKIGITDDATHANMLYYMPDQGTIRNVIVANGGSSEATFPNVMRTQEPPVYLRGAKMYWDHAATADAIRLFSPEYVQMRFVQNKFFKLTPQMRSENSFTVSLLMGVAFHLVNLNPRRSAVLYNFNTT